MSALPVANSPVETIAMVVFSAGAWRVAIEASQVAAALPVGAEELADGAFDDAAALLGCTPAHQASRQCLAIRQPQGSRMILVEGPVELLSFGFDTIHPLPPLLAARTRLPGLRALAQTFNQDDKKTILLFDVCALLAAKHPPLEAAKYTK